MLAQNFKSAAELGLLDVEFEALRSTLRAFECGEVNGVDMTLYRETCGSPSCICGWAHHLSNGIAFPEIGNVRRFDGHNEANESLDGRLPLALRKLFGLAEAVDLSRITPEDAASALRNYLTNGDPNWGDIVSDR